MSIVINDLSFSYDNQSPIFEHLYLSVPDGGKVSVVGDNGTGKSTLLRLIAGLLMPLTGEVACSSAPYYVPQVAGLDGGTVAEMLGVDGKMKALQSILAGSTDAADYDALGDDWEVEARSLAALAHWGLPGVSLTTASASLSGGERTKVLLAGMQVREPGIILLDEPTNHLDRAGRRLLYDFIARTKATVVIVSHDIELLELLDRTCELSPRGLKIYGGNYTFYREQKELETNALEESIDSEEKALRIARRKAQQVRERQDRREGVGEAHKDQLPRIMRKGAMNRGENTAARLQGRHERVMDEGREKLSELRGRRDLSRDLKIDFDDARLHTGKLLVSLRGVNHEYTEGCQVWSEGLDLDIFSGDRLRITGGNGSGKTTLVKIITGQIAPTVGIVKRQNFNYIYLDQDYSMLDPQETVLGMAQRYNASKLADHEVKIRLHRALFPEADWDKACAALSGGERMRLCLCCLMLADAVPDMMILDEPTNNLDISSLDILSRTVSGYRGSLLLISHDDHFARETGVEREVGL